MGFLRSKRVRENLLKYCEFDIFAEVMIIDKLREMIK